MIYPSPFSLIAGLIFGVSVAFLAFRLHALSLSGAIAAAFLGWIVFGLGGWPATWVLLGFFISSSGLSFAFRKQKQSLDEKHAKGNRRDAAQVLANGGIAGLCLILYRIFPEQSWLWIGYCASFAAANADTWASELGVLSKSRPRLITTGREVEMGTSGAITLAGSAAAIFGAFLIALISLIVSPVSLSVLVWIPLIGFAGSLVDSALGATIQAVYFCPTCQKDTERHPIHSCATPTHLIRGYPWFNNDVVNGFCTFTAPVLAGLLAWAGWI